MPQKVPGRDVIVQFWEWYEHHHPRIRNPIASLALDKCEKALLDRDWHKFAYWHAIYLRERSLPVHWRRQ
jgi:hypothetical protein